MSIPVLSWDPAGAFRRHEFDPETRTLTPAEGAEPDHWLVPGFVDIHCHGAFGIDFMSASTEEVRTLCRKLEEVGYDGFLPTTVTASLGDVRRALEALPDDPMVLGFHLEGPFISRKHPGAQPQSSILDPLAMPSGWDAVLDDARLRVITLAPELPGGTELVARLARQGVRVSMGHTDATYGQCVEAAAAGAAHTTHTYNAMRGLHHREPGTVGFALTSDAIMAELIYDRHHVSRPAAEVLFRCKGEDAVIAISDATMAAGLPSGTPLKMWGLDCVVGEGQVRLIDGTLAGSAITLHDAFRNLWEDFGPTAAIKACCLNPRRTLGLDPTAPRSWLLVDREGTLQERFA